MQVRGGDGGQSITLDDLLRAVSQKTEVGVERLRLAKRHKGVAAGARSWAAVGEPVPLRPSFPPPARAAHPAWHGGRVGRCRQRMRTGSPSAGMGCSARRRG